MINNIPTINFFIYAAGIGILIAMIYTNIQRSALSRFINSLIDLGCTSDDSAKTLSELGLTGISASIAYSAAKKQFGIRKAVIVAESEASDVSDTLENAIEKNRTEKYHLAEDCDTELLLKKYNYKALSVKSMFILFIATVVVVFAAVFFTDMIIEKAFAPKLEKHEEQQEQQEQQSENTIEQNENGQEETDDETATDSDGSMADTQDDGKDYSEVETPKVPVA